MGKGGAARAQDDATRRRSVTLRDAPRGALRAAGGVRAEARDGAEVGLGGAHHVADADARRIAAQPQAATAAARRLEQALAAEVGDDLGEVVARQVVLFRQLADGDQALRARRAVHQYAQGVVGVLGQTHGYP